MGASATQPLSNRPTSHAVQAVRVELKTTRYLRMAASQKIAQNGAMDNEENIRDLLRMAKRIAHEELETDNVTAVLAVFDRLCLERDHERFLQASFPTLTRH